LSGLNKSLVYSSKIQQMMKTKILKYGLIVAITGIAIGSLIVLYIFNAPHRDVQSAKVDFKLTANELVKEYLSDASLANDKYLQEEGESKILAVTGTVKSIDKNLENNYVILLQDEALSGVRCTFTIESNDHAALIQEGQKVMIKGVIRSGASYDEDLELYEDVILDKCDII